MNAYTVLGELCEDVSGALGCGSVGFVGGEGVVKDANLRTDLAR